MDEPVKPEEVIMVDPFSELACTWLEFDPPRIVIDEPLEQYPLIEEPLHLSLIDIIEESVDVAIILEVKDIFPMVIEPLLFAYPITWDPYEASPTDITLLLFENPIDCEAYAPLPVKIIPLLSAYPLDFEPSAEIPVIILEPFSVLPLAQEPIPFAWIKDPLVDKPYTIDPSEPDVDCIFPPLFVIPPTNEPLAADKIWPLEFNPYTIDPLAVALVWYPIAVEYVPSTDKSSAVKLPSLNIPPDKPKYFIFKPLVLEGSNGSGPISDEPFGSVVIS